MFKCFISLLLLGAACHAFPGGYLAKGGVMDFQRPLDYMADAKHAGHMAWEHKFQHEAELGALEESRGSRQASYTPVFYTAAQEPVAYPQQGQIFTSHYA